MQEIPPTTHQLKEGGSKRLIEIICGRNYAFYWGSFLLKGSANAVKLPYTRSKSLRLLFDAFLLVYGGYICLRTLAIHLDERRANRFPGKLGPNRFAGGT